MSSKSRSPSHHLESRDGGTGELNDMLDFCLVYPELCQSLFLYLGGGMDHFERLGLGGWDHRFKQDVLCHVTV